MNESLGDLVFDWNAVEPLAFSPPEEVSFDDETLRDGLQSPSATHPTLEERVHFLRLAAAVGIGAADLGLPGAGARAAAEVEALCRAIFTERLPMVPNCAARTREADILPVLEMVQRLGQRLEIAMFLAFSPLRREVEGWTLDEVLARIEQSVGLAVRGGAAVTFVAEDSSRSHPDDLRRIFHAALRAGATRLCLADTSGHATPLGAFQLVRFARRAAREAGFPAVGLDWHGHNDRGLAVANALAAAWAGADRLHATALGVGERVGNPATEQLLVNARLLGWAKPDLLRLGEYAEHAARMLGVVIAPGTPVVGRDAFRTSTGVHAAAIIKAGRIGNSELADLVYSAIPASWLGREQEIEVGPMSGASNVRSWLAEHGHADNEAAAQRIFAAAKQADHTLTDVELHALVVARSGQAVEE
ncbi:MAG: 2-isopropylmalate synthase [Thermoanaerobaculales bacterium]